MRCGRATSSREPNFSLLGEFSFGAFATLGVVSALVWVFALFLSDFFDTMGTLVGVGKPAGYLDKDGDMDNVKRPLLIDSLAAMAGGAASSSSATTYIESGAGVAAGGRTGWTSVVTGALFFPFLFLATADRDGAAAGDGARADHRRLAADQLAHRVRRRSRRGRDRPHRRRA